jgi:hypothetical protein
MRSTFIGSAALACALLSGGLHAGTTYFSFVSTAGTRTAAHEFVFGVTDPATTERLRRIVHGAAEEPGRQHRISGQIARGREAYNSEWPFHLVPSSVRLTEGVDTEVCDATPFEIEDNLHLVGQSFLPGNRWCPWSMRLVREVAIKEPPAPEPTAAWMEQVTRPVLRPGQSGSFTVRVAADRSMRFAGYVAHAPAGVSLTDVRCPAGFLPDVAPDQAGCRGASDHEAFQMEVFLRNDSATRDVDGLLHAQRGSDYTTSSWWMSAGRGN